MKRFKRFKRLTALALTLATILGSALTVNAAPKTMPDGQTFDAEFYAKSNPDVVAALGTDEAALYNHYVSHGKVEGRKPYANADEKIDYNVRYWTDYEVMADGNYLQHPLQYEITAPKGVTVTLTDKEVIDAIKDMVPTGTEWGCETYYDTISSVKGRNIAKRGQGCLAFSYWLTDAIFGTTPMVRYDYLDDKWATADGNIEYHMYDIICYVTTANTFHAGVVIGADAKTQTLYLAEGNVNGKIDWNRSIKADGSDGNKVARVLRRAGM